MFRLFSILTRDLTIKSFFLDDVSEVDGRRLLPAGDTSKTFPSMRINVAAKEFDLPWRHRHAVTFEDFVDAIVPLACVIAVTVLGLTVGSRRVNYSPNSSTRNRPTSTQRAHHVTAASADGLPSQGMEAIWMDCY